MQALLFHAGITGAFATILAAQQPPVWVQVSGSGPPARQDHSMAYDAARGATVLFGGMNGSGQDYADTWTFDGSHWSQQMVTGPSARKWSAMAYDGARQQTILFDGINRLGDTWAWDGSQWHHLTPAQSPAPRLGHAMAWDAMRQRIVLFGGMPGTIPYFADTWEWDGATWTPRISLHIPPARAFHTLSWDSTRQQVVLFGGSTFSGPFSDTWTWDGIDWTQRSPTTHPSARDSSAVADFPIRQVSMLFHGNDGGSTPNAWFWDGSNWTNVVMNYPLLGRQQHAMAYDSAHGDIVLFGGQTFFGTAGDTWLFSVPAVLGNFVPFGQGCGNVSLAAMTGSVPRLGQTFQAVLQGVPAAASGAFVSLGFSSAYVGPFPLPLSLNFAGMPGCTLYQDLTFAYLPAVLGQGTASYSLPIPAQPTLAGTHAFLQAGVQVSGANAAGLLTSNAGDLTIGN